jgi:4-hydroxybenzoate polyprenyltransferase/phosphoserine phosphatase
MTALSRASWQAQCCDGEAAAWPDEATSRQSAEALPLVVDLDGTLLSSDLLIECFLRLLATDPLALVGLPRWMLAGKAGLKLALAERTVLDLSTLPLNEEVVALIRRERERGRRIYLASASHGRLVGPLADHLDLFDGVFATEGDINFAGERKAAALVAAFGERGFDYAGDAEVDRPVWRRARRAIAVKPTRRLQRRLRDEHDDLVVEGTGAVPWRDLARALRPHQWLKNLLVFLPLLTAHRFDAASILAALIAFIAFSLSASSAYLLNDLMDLPHDREHPTKCRRPFACGAVPLLHGMIAIPLLLALGLALAAAHSPLLLGVLALYYAATVLYSVWLKRKVLVDVLTLGGLYTLRVLAGAVAVGVVVSPWLLMFSLFLFLSLGIVKRYAELVDGMARGGTPPSGRGYKFEDLSMLAALGAASGYAATLVVGLYITSDAVTALYRTPELLWLICPLLLYWSSRMLMIAHRGHMHDDPVVFAVTDRVSVAIGVTCVAVVLAAAV